MSLSSKYVKQYHIKFDKISPITLVQCSQDRNQLRKRYYRQICRLPSLSLWVSESHFSHIPRSVSSKPQYLNSKIRLFTPQNPNSMIMDCSLLLHGFFLVVARRRQTVKRPLGEVFLKSQYLNKPSGEVFLKSQCTNKPSGEVFLKSQCINKQFLLNPHDKDMYIRSFLRDGCNNFLFMDNCNLSNHWD